MRKIFFCWGVFEFEDKFLKEFEITVLAVEDNEDAPEFFEAW